MFKRIALFLFILVFFLLFSFFFLLYKLSTRTHTPLTYFPTQIYSSLKNPTITTDFNFLVLGIDPRYDLLEKTMTSDTIMIGRLNSNLHLNIISIPRDLWVYSLSSKVNEIYQKSTSRSQVLSRFSELTGQRLDKYVLISTDNLVKLTTLIGGVDVTLDQAYTDTKYPNPAYIATPSTKVPMYITISFQKGLNHLQADNIAAFVRSRKGQTSDGVESTDIGRTIRQQLLLDAILAKIKSPDFYQNPTNLLNLYNFWHSQIDSNITDQDIFSLIFHSRKALLNIKLNKTTIPASESTPSGIIYHPASFSSQQWVYVPQDKNYLSFQQYISDFLAQ
ncbi:MAG: LCP family protein [Microgenomates group bacterium]